MEATAHVIDLGTRIVPRSKKVWRLFAGRSYRFLEFFQKQGCVFLDFPLAPLPEGPLSSDTPVLDEITMASRRLRSWAYELERRSRLRQTWGEPEQPSTNPKDYIGQALPKGLQIYKSALVGLFGLSQRGDLVLFPDRPAQDRVWIGEFLDGPGNRVSATFGPWYGNIAIPARRVHWFPVVRESEFHLELVSGLRRPNPFVTVSETYYHQVFSNSYGSYQYGDLSAARIRASGADFSIEDNLDLMLLMKLAAVLTHASEKGNVTPFRTFDEILNYRLPADYVPNLSIGIHSPGAIDAMAGHIVPLVFLALFSLLSVASAEEMPKPSEVQVTNTAAGADDRCSPLVDARVRDSLGLVHYDLYKKACEIQARLASTPNVSTDTRTAIAKSRRQ